MKLAYSRRQEKKMNLSQEIQKLQKIIKEKESSILRIIYEADDIALHKTQLKQHQGQLEVMKKKNWQRNMVVMK